MLCYTSAWISIAGGTCQQKREGQKARQGAKYSQMAEPSDELCLVHHVCGNLHSPHAVHGLKVLHELGLSGRHCGARPFNVVRYIVPDLQSKAGFVTFPVCTYLCKAPKKQGRRG